MKYNQLEIKFNFSEYKTNTVYFNVILCHL